MNQIISLTKPKICVCRFFSSYYIFYFYSLKYMVLVWEEYKNSGGGYWL